MKYLMNPKTCHALLADQTTTHDKIEAFLVDECKVADRVLIYREGVSGGFNNYYIVCREVGEVDSISLEHRFSFEANWVAISSDEES